MTKTWKHPQLGSFKFNSGRESWVGTCSLPAFTVFKYKWEAFVPEPIPEHELTFRDTEGREPSASAVKLALRVIANQATLPSLITSALWAQFNGRGPKSEMWWYGDMHQIAEAFECDELPRPTGPDDLLRVMRSRELTIRESIYEYKKPIAELSFAAGFEPEHGVGILTDGSAILGTGYASDVLPYDLQHHE